MAVLIARPTIAVKNILVATDFSPASELAIDYAGAIARRYGSRLHLVHALPPPSHGQSPANDIVKVKQAEADAVERLRAEAKTCVDIECSQWVLKGTPLEVVDRLLSFHQIDLVVVGSHGAKGLRRLSVGSAAEHFFRHVHCPVLAIGPSMSGRRPVWEPKRVLLTTDLQSDESAAAKCAVLIASEHDAHLTLLHVAPPAPAPFPDDQGTMARSYFELRLRELLSYKPELEYPAELLVEFGEDAVSEIVRVARVQAMDLIVLSVHREEPWGFHFVHEAYRIVAEAPVRC